VEQAIFRAVGNEFNIGSTKQLGDVLFETLGLPGGKKGKAGSASIAEELALLPEVPGHVLEQHLPSLARFPSISTALKVAATLSLGVPHWRNPRHRSEGKVADIVVLAIARCAVYIRGGMG
jgi:hypothetical protein